MTNKRPETAEEWFERITREHGPVPMRIGRRLAHLRQQQEVKARREVDDKKPR